MSIFNTIYTKSGLSSICPRDGLPHVQDSQTVPYNILRICIISSLFFFKNSFGKNVLFFCIFFSKHFLLSVSKLGRTCIQKCIQIFMQNTLLCPIYQKLSDSKNSSNSLISNFMIFRTNWKTDL